MDIFTHIDMQIQIYLWLSILEIVWITIGLCGELVGFQTTKHQKYQYCNSSLLVIHHFLCHGVQGVEGSNPFISTRKMNELGQLEEI